MVRSFTIVLFILFVNAEAYSQVNCFARVSLDKHSMYAQEPFKATITVSTATWYTTPLDFDNIQIPNAFILPFSRTLSTMLTIDGKQYASLQFYFIVFPYKPGSYSFPAINIRVETPPQGSAVSQKVTIHTTPQKFVVKDVPEKMKDETWFVAKNVYITQHWNKSLNNLKVGDVVKRTIVIDAKGTLPQFIPGFKNDSLNWASAYPGEADLADTRDDYDANGKRTQTITYLLEKEGTFAVPPVELTWWNPNSSRMYKRSAAGVTLHVNPNPNLGILTTLKDSLNASAQKKVIPEQHKGPLRIYGILWYWFALYALLGLVIIYVLARLLISSYRKIRTRYKNYLISEPNWFRKFLRSGSNVKQAMAGLYTWWDRWPAQTKLPSIHSTMKNEDEGSILQEIDKYNKKIFDEQDDNAVVDNDFKSLIGKFRKEKSGEEKLVNEVDENQRMWNVDVK